MKTIGVIGGIGPQATMDFEERVHRVSQALIPQFTGTGYPPLVVFYLRHPPLLLNDDGSPVLPRTPHPGLIDAAKKLGALADFIVITSNGAHIFREQVEAASGLKVLSIIDVTLDEVRRRGWRRSGVIGMGEPLVYMGPMSETGMQYETLEAGKIGPLDRALLQVMEGQATDAGASLAREAVTDLRQRGVDGVILGCTELPLLLADAAAAPDLINPAHLLAEAAVRHALEP